MAINPATRANTRSYCSPDTGVHYGLDVAAGKYIVGYTGTSKRGFLSEEVRSVKSTFSIWPAEDHNVAAVIADPVAHGAFQNEIRIAASGSEPVFAVYQRLSGGLRIYTIEDRK